MLHPVRQFLKTRMGTAAASLAAVFLVYLGWSAFGHPPAGLESAVSSLVLIAYCALAAAFGFRLAADRHAFDPRLRRAWRLLAFSAVCTTAAEVIWFGLETLGHRDPTPSAADLFFLAYYPLRLAGIMALPFVASKRSERSTLWLDLGIVMAAGFVGLWYFLAAPIWVAGVVDASTLAAIAYPAADLIAVAGLVILAERDMERVRLGTVLLLAMNIILAALADTFFAFIETRSLQASPFTLNALWVAAGLCDVLAVAWMLGLGQHPHLDSRRPAHPARRLLRLILPYLAAFFGLTVLVVAALSDPPQPRAYLVGTVIGSLALMALAMLRQFVVLRENILLQEETTRLATIDSLTGLSNRRTLDEALEKEIERALRYSHPLTVLMLDIDGFKAFNDRHGHLQGDAALRGICDSLRTQVRSSDLLARFGGDEFVLLLPETTQEGALAVGAKMRESTRNLRFAGSPLDLSIGVAEYRAGMTPRDLLDEVDRSLYRHKRGIRQRPSEAADPPASAARDSKAADG